MAEYGKVFSLFYNKKWSGFAEQVAPVILEFYEHAPASKTHKSLLDVCCGTGQLALHFLQHGYKVVGIDLSEHMLKYAQENAASYIKAGQARFIQGDAICFDMGEQFGLVVSTFNALNHLGSVHVLKKCFDSVFAALVEGGFFIFDLLTHVGLKRWNNIYIEDSDEITLITRGSYDKADNKALMRISGFIRTSNELYERFDEMLSNTAFELQQVRDALIEAGWKDVYFAKIQDLTTAIVEPEKEERIFVIASK